MEAGVYVGYSPFKNIIDLSILSDTSVHGKTSYFTPMPYGHILSYGLNANVHFMPFFIKKSESRFDFYFTAKYGGRSSLTTKSYRYRHDLGFGFGFACYFSHHTGIYAEWLLTQGLFNKRPEITLPENIVFMPFFYERSTFRVGFTVKFKPNNEKQKNNE
ncbi:MAG: hypothetical protein LBI03_00590 [Clostridiales bacterium]|nr:hypothetical protein [Clostridiales bacterium]